MSKYRIVTETKNKTTIAQALYGIGKKYMPTLLPPDGGPFQRQGVCVDFEATMHSFENGCVRFRPKNSLMFSAAVGLGDVETVLKDGWPIWDRKQLEAADDH